MACPENIISSSPGLSRKHYLFLSWLVQKTLPLHLLACPENIISSSHGLPRKHYLFISGMSRKHYRFISWLVQKTLPLHVLAGEKVDNIKGVIRSHNHRRKTDNAMIKRKRTNNDLQNTTQKTKDQATRTLL
jgi:hypothetical protein